MKTKRSGKIAGIIAVALAAVIALVTIIGTDTNWGKVEVTRMTLTSADGDEISAMLYKPNTATAENPAPAVMYCHGGNDMLEQGGSYALELARRGYVVVSWDYSGCARSDIPTGTSESVAMGGETVFRLVKSYNFVDQSKIVASGHSMGGAYTMMFSCIHQDEIFLQVNLGMNNFGPADDPQRDFNFCNILGIADESTLARTNDDVSSIFRGEQFRRIFLGDYETPEEQLPQIENGKVYTVTGTNGKQYTRANFVPDSCHAYYLTTNDAVQTFIYAITSTVGVGLDPGVNSYADHNKISTVWQMKDAAFFFLYLCVAAAMFLAVSILLDMPAFQDLKLESVKGAGFKPKSPMWWGSLAILAILPVALYRPGVMAMNKFFGIDISGVWLLGGTNNAYISWQWTVAVALLALFLVFHFAWGKKNGGGIRAYGFATGNDDKFHIAYVGKALALGLCSVGVGYLLFAFVSAYTQQGLHIGTFMLNTLKTNRTLAFVMYFLFQIPYFLCSSLAYKSIGVGEGDDSGKGIAKTVGITTLISMGGLLLMWLIFFLLVTVGHTLTPLGYFRNDRMYIYTIAILPLVIGMAVANALNIYVSKKTNSIWAGLFTALLWGSWIITSCGGMAKYVY